jgi:tetratricopeptide (TPR) repeat protein
MYDFAAMHRDAAGRCRWWLANPGGIVLMLALIAARPAAQTPALPRLPLSAYATETRDAVEPMLKAAAARPTDASAAGALGRTLQAWQQWDAAHEAFRRAQTLEPAEFQWFYVDGVVLQRLARHAEAADTFRRALAVTPDYLPARVKYAESLLKSGDLAESERIFTALLEDPLAETLARFGLGRIAANQGSTRPPSLTFSAPSSSFRNGAKRTTRSPCRIGHSIAVRKPQQRWPCTPGSATSFLCSRIRFWPARRRSATTRRPASSGASS